MRELCRGEVNQHLEEVGHEGGRSLSYSGLAGMWRLRSGWDCLGLMTLVLFLAHCRSDIEMERMKCNVNVA